MEQWAVTLLMWGAASGPTSAMPPLAVEPWQPKGISSAQFESHPAFDPVTGDFYFVRSAPDFAGWRILVSHCGPRGWSAPRAPPFAGDGVEADPFFTNEGRTLYFISTRSTDGVHRSDLDIWRVDRDADGTVGNARCDYRSRSIHPRRNGFRGPGPTAGSTSDRAGPAASVAPTSGARSRPMPASRPRGSSRTPVPRSTRRRMSTSRCPPPTARR